MERGELEIETDGPNIIVRLREQGSLSLARPISTPRPRLPSPPSRVYCRLNKGVFWCWAIRTTSPSKPRFRSNWELSAVRAVAVADALMNSGLLARSRFEVTGFADTHPLTGNDSAQGRARNRRVK